MMVLVWQIIFWLPFFLLVFRYLGYPIVLWLLSRLMRPRRQCQGSDQDLPTVTLIISAYNEEQIIEEKLQNSLQLQYPAGRLQLLVVSDGSTDRTHEICRTYAADGVELCIVE